MRPRRGFPACAGFSAFRSSLHFRVELFEQCLVFLFESVRQLLFVCPSRARTSWITCIAAISAITHNLFDHAGFDDLTFFHIDALAFQRPIEFFDGPSTTVPSHHPLRIRDAIHLMRGQQRPCHGFLATWWDDFFDMHDASRTFSCTFALWPRRGRHKVTSP